MIRMGFVAFDLASFGEEKEEKEREKEKDWEQSRKGQPQHKARANTKKDDQAP